jgi:NAD(P)-dependent dehydrogenase (short-subunit alcohol dehydrogenase family)
MIIRSQKGIIRPNPKYALTSLTSSFDISCDPYNIRSTLAHPGWKAIIEEELEALHNNKT